jgi:NAD(P)-dependent dehydrogenase (short-subunit alcohol dehydrogenase family)
MAEVVVVTGASGALGAEIARTLSKRGHKLALFGSVAAAARLDALAGSLGSAIAIAGDLASEAMWREAMPRIERELGAAPSLAALIAGAWRGGRPLHEETTDDTWRTMMSANVDTVYRSLRALLPGMTSGRRGSIVVVGSRAAEQPWTSPRAAAYAASKAAVVALTRAVAAEVLAYDVRVNAILPSTMDTPANRAAMPEADPALWVSLPSAAAVIAFLLSDDARDISGAAIPVYGKS